MSIKFKYLTDQLLQVSYSILHHSDEVKMWLLLFWTLKEQKDSHQITYVNSQHAGTMMKSTKATFKKQRQAPWRRVKLSSEEWPEVQQINCYLKGSELSNQN